MGNPYPQIVRTKQHIPFKLISAVTHNQDTYYPITITMLDGGNLSESTSLTRSFRHQLPYMLIVDCMLEHLCSLYASSSDQQKELYDALRKYFVRFQLLPSADGFSGMDTFRQQLYSDLNHLFHVAKRNMARISCGSDKALSTLNVPINRAMWTSKEGSEHFFSSRYENDFKELEFIASGGFGVVYKASNKLDGNDYAIKKVIVRSHSAQRIIREVQLLSRLNHPNVVAYKSAWLEICTPLVLKDIKARMESDGTLLSTTSTSDTQSVPSIGSDSCNSAVFTEVSSSKSVTSTNRGGSTHRSMVVANYVRCASQHLDGTLLTPPLMVLYIQMQLCPQTLRMWLNERNGRVAKIEDNQSELNIFRQILDGIEYVHKSNIVHRDIKPENIFLCLKTGQALIGDFGLAKFRSEMVYTANSSQLSTPQVMHPCPVSTFTTKGVGTQSYAAPEQLKGTGCDSKSDMYSLGIVLLELLTVFKTDMERHKSIEKLRKKQQIPQSVTGNWSLLTDLIVDLACPNPRNRPTAQQTLERLSDIKSVNQSKSTRSYSKMESVPIEEQHCVSKLHRQIEKLKRELAEKDETIQRLTRILSSST